MDTWQQQLHVDPIPPLLSSNQHAIQYFTRRDLLAETVNPITELWELPEPQKLIKKQNGDGSWSPSGNKKEIYPPYHYHLVETWRNFRVFVEQYEFTSEHPAARTAAEYLLTYQTDEGDIRGMIANQYATYYTGAILSLLIKAGYQDDPRIEKGMNWLLSMRQDDGAWTIPILTVELTGAEKNRVTSQYAEPFQPDRTQPFSHLCTGMVLRAFAAHPRYRHSDEARKVANLLKARFFHEDYYSSYQAASYWIKFDYPYWWNHLLAALDSISTIGLSRDDEDVQCAVDWFIQNQQKDGLWKTNYAQPEQDNAKTHEKRLWISLAICRVLKRLFA